MRVAMYYNNSDVRVEEMPAPEIGPGELLVRIDASGICGSDVMEWYRVQRAPLVLGHEVAGTVAQVGDGVERFREGDRVVATHHVPCNACRYCLSGHHTVCDTLRTTNYEPGGFAEFVRLPAVNVERGVFPVPDGLGADEASFAEPLACVYRGQRRANIEPGQSVLVLGSGLAGLLHINLARALGAGRIVATDLSDFRLDAARRLGADFTFSATDDVPARLREVNDGRLADLVIVATGARPGAEPGAELGGAGRHCALLCPHGTRSERRGAGERRVLPERRHPHHHLRRRSRRPLHGPRHDRRRAGAGWRDDLPPFGPRRGRAGLQAHR